MGPLTVGCEFDVVLDACKWLFLWVSPRGVDARVGRWKRPALGQRLSPLVRVRCDCRSDVEGVHRLTSRKPKLAFDFRAAGSVVVGATSTGFDSIRYEDGEV